MSSQKSATALLFAAILVSAGLPAQERTDRPLTLSVGLSSNPGLAILHKEYELGPVVSFSLPVWKQWDLGGAAIVRSVWYRTPDRKYGYKQNISFPYDKESVYAIQAGYTTRERKWVHGFHLHPGIRLERYSEVLRRPDLGLDESYTVKENNFFLAASYSLRRRIREDQFLGIRWMLPFDRIPRDDVNRYSLELSWYFVFRNRPSAILPRNFTGRGG